MIGRIQEQYERDIRELAYAKSFAKTTETKSPDGHATVRRLSNTRQSSEVTRSSADCQTTFFPRFKQIGNFFKKVTKRSRDSRRRSCDRRPTVKQRFFDVSTKLAKFWKQSLNGHATVVGGHATVGRLSNNFFPRFKQIGNFLKKVAERSRDSRGRSRDRRPTVKQFYFDVSAKMVKFSKKSRNVYATVVGGHATVGRLSNNLFQRFKQIGNFWKKSLNGHATVVGGHATVGRLSTTFFHVSSKSEIFTKSR